MSSAISLGDFDCYIPLKLKTVSKVAGWKSKMIDTRSLTWFLKLAHDFVCLCASVCMRVPRLIVWGIPSSPSVLPVTLTKQLSALGWMADDRLAGHPASLTTLRAASRTVQSITPSLGPGCHFPGTARRMAKGRRGIKFKCSMVRRRQHFSFLSSHWNENKASAAWRGH